MRKALTVSLAAVTAVSAVAFSTSASADHYRYHRDNDNDNGPGPCRGDMANSERCRPEPVTIGN